MKRRLLGVLRYPMLRLRRFMIVNVLHANDPPHQLALGAAIGVFVAFTPTVGIQMMLVLLLAYLMGANKVIGLPVVWVSNPATFVPIYYSCYYLGRTILRQPGIGLEWWSELKGTHTISFYWSKLLEVATPLWVGCFVVALALAYPTYCTVYMTVRSYRLKRWGQLVPPAADEHLAAALAQIEADESEENDAA